MLTNKFCPKLVPIFWSDKMQIINVESATLSASYYKEYLGFTILYKKVAKNGDEILVCRGSNLIRINSKSLKLSQTTQEINIYSKNIMCEYASIKDKVRIISPLNVKFADSFSVLDCNGIKIVYKST